MRWAPITSRVIAHLTNCKVYARYGTGYDNIDWAAAAAKDAYVTNVPDYCREEVSDQALALLLSAARKISSHDRAIRQRNCWDIASADPIHRMAGKTLGIVGLGRIGRTFLRKTRGLNFGRTLVTDPYINGRDASRDLGVAMVPIETLLAQSDYISLHVPLTAETHRMIGAKELGLMKRTAILVNTARGAVVHEDALITALREGWINSAGLDVYETEPLDENSPLKHLDNVVLSDHGAWYSEEAEVELKTLVARNAVDALQGRVPRHTVPEVIEAMRARGHISAAQDRNGT